MHVCVIRDKHLKNFRSWLSLRKFTCWASIHSSRLWRENRRTVLLWCWIYTSPHFKLTDEYFKTDWIKSISKSNNLRSVCQIFKKDLKNLLTIFKRVVSLFTASGFLLTKIRSMRSVIQIIHNPKVKINNDMYVDTMM